MNETLEPTICPTCGHKEYYPEIGVCEFEEKGGGNESKGDR